MVADKNCRSGFLVLHLVRHSSESDGGSLGEGGMPRLLGYRDDVIK